MRDGGWPRRLSFLRRTCSSRGISSSRQMDLGLPSISVCIMVIAWLASEHCLNGEQTICECPEIPPANLTKPPPRACHNVGSSFRYTCIEGYVRKAGTSNLIKCKQSDGVPYWTPLDPVCIPKPNRGTVQPPSLTPAAPGFTRPDQTLMWNQSSTATVTEGSKGIRLTSPSQSPPDSPKENSKNQAMDGPPSTSPGNEESNHTTVTALLLLVIVSALIGLGIFHYKRRAGSNMTQQTEEGEVVPMKSDPS